ncbi:MAG: hypothetical protein RLZZ326_2805 [Planctomycetota bacterium]|jgi:hypothetical protein
MFAHGMRVRGPIYGPRARVDWVAATNAYRHCLPSASVDQEAYLSVFTFPDAFAGYLAAHGSPAGYEGEVGAEAVLWDIDREDLAEAHCDARNLVATLEETFDVPPTAIEVFFSGRRGFHVVVPTSLWRPQPSDRFHAACRAFAEAVATEAKIKIDSSVYNRVHLVRATNSRHPKTGLNKVRVDVDRMTIGDIQGWASKPQPIEPWMPVDVIVPALEDLWLEAVESSKQSSECRRPQEGRLNRLTKSLLRGEFLDLGDRHRHVFSAAANLAECGASLSLATDLLWDVAREAGLPPKEITRQIDCGFKKGTT